MINLRTGPEILEVLSEKKKKKWPSLCAINFYLNIEEWQNYIEQLKEVTIFFFANKNMFYLLNRRRGLVKNLVAQHKKKSVSKNNPEEYKVSPQTMQKWNTTIFHS